MLINFSPIRSDEQQSVITVDGDVLTIDGEEFDFSPLPEGATVTALSGIAARKDGVVEVTVKLTHGANAPHETRFPEPVLVESGPVPIPLYDVVEEVETEEGAQDD